MKIKSLIIISCIVFLCAIVFFRKAFSLDQETKDLCNQVMMNIFDDLEKQKEVYPELSNFGSSNLTTNQFGFYNIQYKFEDKTQPENNQIFEFGITIVGINEPRAFATKRSTFDLGFPLLDLRFSGYQRRNINTRRFNLEEIVQKEGQVLWDSQQKYMPYQLKITAVKSEYKVGEDIDFIVSLCNTTQSNISIKDLSSNTLYFLYDNKMWGAVEVNPDEVPDRQIVLKAGEVIRKTFRGPHMNTPQEFEIYVSYGLTYQGIKPSDSLKIKVVQ